MSKPKLKGNTIGVRLPLGLDAEVRERAAARGLSPGVYLSASIARSMSPEPRPVSALDERRPLRRQEVQDESNKRTPVDECFHATRVPIAGGLMRCEKCQKVRGADGSWR